MAVVTKYWNNGDALTLDVGVSGISVYSDENKTHNERHMEVVVKTTKGTPQRNESVLIRQSGHRVLLGAGDKFLMIGKYIQL